MPMVGNPESALIAGMSATPALEGPSGGLAASALSMPDTSLSLGVALQEPAFWSYDFDPATGVSRATYPGEVSVAGWPAAGPVSSFNTRSGAVTLSLADVTGAGGAPLQPNRVDNSGFQINQRSYVSGTALAAGAYGHDRWKAGASGCTYTFTQAANGGPDTTITITAGSLQQVVPASTVTGGIYTLQWFGTAQGRVNGAAYAASPNVTASLPANTNVTIEFNAGTVGEVRIVSGSLTANAAWAPDNPTQALRKCQAFYQSGQIVSAGSCTAGLLYAAPYGMPVTMRAVPNIAITAFGSTVNLNNVAINPVSSPTAARDFYCTGTCVATGAVTLNFQFNASADL